MRVRRRPPRRDQRSTHWLRSRTRCALCGTLRTRHRSPPRARPAPRCPRPNGRRCRPRTCRSKGPPPCEAAAPEPGDAAAALLLPRPPRPPPRRPRTAPRPRQRRPTAARPRACLLACCGLPHPAAASPPPLRRQRRPPRPPVPTGPSPPRRRGPSSAPHRRLPTGRGCIATVPAAGRAPRRSPPATAARTSVRRRASGTRVCRRQGAVSCCEAGGSGTNRARRPVGAPHELRDAAERARRLRLGLRPARALGARRSLRRWLLRARRRVLLLLQRRRRLLLRLRLRLRRRRRLEGRGVVRGGCVERLCHPFVHQGVRRPEGGQLRQLVAAAQRWWAWKSVR